MPSLPPLTFVLESMAPGSSGALVVQLFDHRMPISCARFRAFAAAGFYDGTHLHRVSTALVQGGCPHSRDLGSPHVGVGGSPEGPFPDEHPANAHIGNDAGTIGFTPGPRHNTSDCQFFINVVDNRHLDWWAGGAHAVFGRVVQGLELLRAVSRLPNDGRAVGERPKVPVRVVSVR